MSEVDNGMASKRNEFNEMETIDERKNHLFTKEFSKQWF